MKIGRKGNLILAVLLGLATVYLALVGSLFLMFGGLSDSGNPGSANNPLWPFGFFTLAVLAGFGVVRTFKRYKKSKQS